MKKVLTLSLLPLLVCSCSGSKIPEGYKLVFEDEFNGPSLNEDYWSYMIGNGAEYGNPGWGNGELQYYQKDNVIVKDGKLTIRAKKQTVGDFQYTSARIRTTKKAFFKYGRVEASIKLPAQKAMWPAFWMLPEEFAYGGWPDSGEIDIMEANGGSKYGTTAAVHYSVTKGVDTYQTGYNAFNPRDNQSIDQFHVYAVEWEEEEFRFYVDDKEILTVPMRTWSSGTVDKNENPKAPFDKDFHILLNMAIGGNYVKNVNPEADFTEADMEIEYVRVYQYEG